MAISNLNLASSISIKTAIANLKSDFNTNLCWVNPSNNYIDDTIDKINAQLGSSSLVDQDAIDYIASSVFIHSSNSWSYLSMAIHSLLEGDYGAAIHNAYYAELRAIMSFLATQGIGVFDKGNLIVDSTGKVHKATCPNYAESRTHNFAKTALDQWLSDTANASALIDIIKVEDKSINDWITATGFDASTYLPGMLAKGWINTWSLDMSIMSKDTNLRNVVSYRPQNFNLNFSPIHDGILERISFIEEMWKLCNPNSLFETTLWRLSLEYVYKNLFSYSSISELDRKKDLEPLFVALGKNPSSNVSSNLIDFLERGREPIDNAIFSKASFNSIPIQETNIEPFGILSRACLMTNFATRSAQNLLSQTRTIKSDIQFWLDNLGIKSGFWELGSEPSLFSDLWLDVELELYDIAIWKSKSLVSGSYNNPYKYNKEMKSNLFTVKQFNRSYLWNLKI
ncbi:MAG TPA: hypothetical protein VN026_03465 [Bacteroidia bacterium]|jgi:hypothetical protein|nr:hypothetical protein [Bacteroidia bacterium]